MAASQGQIRAIKLYHQYLSQMCRPYGPGAEAEADLAILSDKLTSTNHEGSWRVWIWLSETAASLRAAKKEMVNLNENEVTSPDFVTNIWDPIFANFFRDVALMDKDSDAP